MQKNDNDADLAYHYLLKLLCEAEEKQYLVRLLAALMTDKEQHELTNRLRIFALLQRGLTQREISKKLGVGIATVSRGAKAFQQHQIDELLPNIDDEIV
ncbi:MAG: transcriptional regulator [Gammaproteobacteria bacterium]|nr:MAG: transcriptional regulator [Gammaproteobacteria bacterium]